MESRSSILLLLGAERVLVDERRLDVGKAADRPEVVPLVVVERGRINRHVTPQTRIRAASGQTWKSPPSIGDFLMSLGHGIGSMIPARLYDPAARLEHHGRNRDLVAWDNLAIQHARTNVVVEGPARTLRKVASPLVQLDLDEMPAYNTAD